MISLNLSLLRVLLPRCWLFRGVGCEVAAMLTLVDGACTEALEASPEDLAPFVVAPSADFVEVLARGSAPSEMWSVLCGTAVEIGREVLPVGSAFSRCSWYRKIREIFLRKKGRCRTLGRSSAKVDSPIRVRENSFCLCKALG